MANIITQVTDYIRNREWVATMTAATAVLLWVENQLTWISDTVNQVPVSGARTADYAIVLFGAWSARRNVNSHRAVADLLDAQTGQPSDI